MRLTFGTGIVHYAQSGPHFRAVVCIIYPNDNAIAAKNAADAKIIAAVRQFESKNRRPFRLLPPGWG